MKLKLENGKIVDGKLNWTDSKKYSHNNTDYLSVPFKFSPGVIVTDGGDNSYRNWQLVFRGANEGEIEAAVQSTTFGDIVEERSQSKIQGANQNFTVLNGEQATLWIKMENSAKYILENQLDNNESKIFSKTAMGCETFAVTTLVPYSYLGEGSGYDQEIIFAWHTVTNYVTLCDDDAPIRKEQKKIWYIDSDQPGSLSEEYLESELSSILNSASTTSQIKSINSEINDLEERTKVYQWYCITAPSYKIISTEIGIHEKTHGSNPNLEWTWKSLTHTSLAMEGFVVGVDFKYSLVFAVPTIGLYGAMMDMSVNLEASRSIVGVKITKSRNLRPKKTFSVND